MTRRTDDTWTDESGLPPGSAAGRREERYGPTGVVLGAGGLGRVDLVADHHLGRDVAKKTLLSDAPAVRARFVREARVTAQLEHPSIVPLYELGTDADGRPFYTMRRIVGRTLGETVRGTTDLKGRLALLPHVVAACQAVAYAHARGVLHRDLKPANVMVGAFGETLVVDWGLAKVDGDEPDGVDAAPEGSDPTVTRVGAVVGSPAYMSPEQARGEVVDARSDVWGLGTLLFEVLAGRPPFDGLEVDTLLALLRSGVPEDVDGACAEAPRDLVAVVRKALHPQREQRYPDAAAMAEDLSAWVAGGFVHAYRYSRLERARSFARRQPIVIPALASLAVLGLVLVVGGAVSVIQLARERDRAVLAERERAREGAGSLVALARTDADLGNATDAAARLDEAEATFARLGDPLEPVELVRAWVEYLHPTPILDKSAFEMSAAALSRSGRWVGLGGEGHFELYELPSGRLERSIDRPGVALHPLFDGDRPLLVTREGDGLRVVDLADGAVLARFSSLYVAPYLRPNGVWVASPEGTQLLERGTGRALLGAPLPASRVLDVSADGERVLGYTVPAGSPNRQPERVSVWDTDGRVVMDLPGATTAALAPSGRLAAVHHEGALELLRDDGGGWKRSEPGLRLLTFASDEVVLGGFATGRFVRWSASDGAELDSGWLPGTLNAVSAASDVVLLLSGERWVVHAGRPFGRRLPRVSAAATAVVGGPDGTTLAVVGWDGRLVVADRATGFVLRELRVSPDGVRGAALSADGRRAVTADRGGRVKVWDLLDPSDQPALDLGGDGIAVAARFVDQDTRVLGLFEAGGLREWDATDGQPTRTAALPLHPWGVGVTGADRLVVSGRAFDDPEWTVVARDGAVVAAGPSGVGYGVAEAPDGRHALVSAHDGSLWWVDAEAGTASAWSSTAPSVNVAVDARGELAAAVTFDGDLVLYSVPDGRLVGTFPLHRDGSPGPLAFAGDALVSLDSEGYVHTLDLGPDPAEADPTDAVLHRTAARRLARVGAFAEAADEYERAVAAGAPVPALERVRALAAAGRPAEALAALGPDGEVAPVTIELWRNALSTHAPGPSGEPAGR